MSSRPSVAVSGKKSSLKSKKYGCTIAKKKAQQRQWVETITDLAVYKPSKAELENRKNDRLTSTNKMLAKVSLNDQRALSDPDRQKLIEQQVMRDYQRHSNGNVESIVARSEHVLGICQRILNGEINVQPPGAAAEPDSAAPLSPAGSPNTSFTSLEYEEQSIEEEKISSSSPAKKVASKVTKEAVPIKESPPRYPNSALSEVTAELLVTVKQLREELIEERAARQRLAAEVAAQRLLLTDLAREVLRLQMDCNKGVQLEEEAAEPKQGDSSSLAAALEGTRIV